MVILSFVACKANENYNNLNNNKLEDKVVEENTKIYDAFKACSAYPWLSQIQFSPCTAIEKRVKEIDNDSQKELLVDYTVVSNGTWRYIDILQFSNDSDMIYLFEKSVDSFEHELSYYFSSDVPKKFILKDVKVNGKKKMKTEKKTYCYRDKKYILE